MAVVDAVAYKETTRQQWQNAAEAWHRWDDVLRAWLGPATEVMLAVRAARRSRHEVATKRRTRPR